MAYHDVSVCLYGSILKTLRAEGEKEVGACREILCHLRSKFHHCEAE
jgi:hypothetical protein